MKHRSKSNPHRHFCRAIACNLGMRHAFRFGCIKNPKRHNTHHPFGGDLPTGVPCAGNTARTVRGGRGAGCSTGTGSSYPYHRVIWKF